MVAVIFFAWVQGTRIITKLVSLHKQGANNRRPSSVVTSYQAWCNDVFFRNSPNHPNDGLWDYLLNFQSTCNLPGDGAWVGKKSIPFCVSGWGTNNTTQDRSVSPSPASPPPAEWDCCCRFCCRSYHVFTGLYRLYSKRKTAMATGHEITMGLWILGQWDR